MALNIGMLKKIKAIAGDNSPVGTGETVSNCGPSCLIDLIVQHASNGAVGNIAKGLFVTLPDQYHCYYMTENKSLQGTIISSIPFTEPQHVSKVLVFLRQQALFNQLLSSCIRNNGASNTRITDYENLLVFEVAALSCQYITVSLEHPFEESLAMVEFDLRNVMAIHVRIFCNGYETDDRISNRVSLIVQRTMSIPVTLRGLIKIWQEEYEVKFKGKLNAGAAPNGGGNSAMDEGNFSLSLGPDEGGGNCPTGPGGGVSSNGGAASLNGQHNGSLNGSGMVHQDYCDVKKVKLEPMDSSNKRRGGEDFCRSPKSSNIESEGVNEEMEDEEDDDEYDESTNLSSGDSNNSLGGNQQINIGQHLSSSSSSSTTTAAAIIGAPIPLNLAQSLATTGNVSESSGNSSILENLDLSSLDPDLMRSSNDSDLEDSVEMNESEMKHKSDDRPSYTTSVSITPIGVGKSSSTMTNSVLNNIGLDKRPGIEIIPLANASANVSSSITITPIPLTSSGGSSKLSSISCSDKRLSGNSSIIQNRKGGGSSSEYDRAKLEKKKKRKYEEQLAQLQMGPPNKILSKSSDGPSSPSSSSRKFSVSPVPLKSGSSSSSGQLFLSGGSPGTGSKSSPKHSPVHHSSPKHQSSFGTSSPKHISGGSSGGGKPSMSALKSATSSGSPSSKSSSSNGGGKEDGSGIKSGSSGSSSSRDRDRDRDRDKSEKKSGYSSSSNSSSPKLKTPAIKLKQLDLSNCGTALSAGVQLELMNSNSSGGSSSGSGSIDLTESAVFGGGAADLSKNSAAAASAAGMLLLQQAMKNRKGSLSAVIDKLKSAQSGDESTLLLLPELAQQAGFSMKEATTSSKTASPSSSSSAPSSTTTTPVSNFTGTSVGTSASSAAAAAALAAHLSSAAAVMQGKNSEYMVKPSLDGIKLTIQNKKSSKSGSSSSSSSSSKSSSKSGFKPHVSSGSMSSSKKLPSSHSFSGSLPSSSSSAGKSSSSSSSKAPFQKSSSSGSLSSSSSTIRSSSKSGSASSGGSGSKDKSRSSSKSSAVAAAAAASSLLATNAAMVAAANANALNVMKMLGLTSSIQSMEGFVKTLDTKFQIPKLSARSTGSGGSDVDKLKQESRPTSSSAPNTPLSNIAQSPTGSNDFSLPFNKLPGDVSPMHSAMLPNVMQKMFSSHDSSMLLRRSPNLENQGSSNSRDGFASIYGKGSTAPTTPTGSVPPPFPSPVNMQSHAMDFSNSSDSLDANLMRPPSRPSSTLSNHSSSDKLIDATTNSNSMDGLRSTSPAQALAAAAVAAQFMNKLDNTQLVAALKNHHHHLNALSNAAAVAAAAAAAASASAGSAGSGPVPSPTSVSVHIVKSPVPSPLPLHGGTNSTGAPDEDEGLVGISGK